MKFGTLLVVGAGCCLLADAAHAQSFLERMAGRAAGAAGAVAGGLPGRFAGDTVSNPDGTASPALPGQPRERGRGRILVDDAPEAQGEQGLPEEERSRACAARYPTDGLSGDAYMRRSAQFGACMGPNWGDGG